MHNRTALVIAISCISSLSSGLVIGASSVPTEGQDLCWEFLKFYDTSQTSCSPMSNSLWNFFLVTSFCISAFISSLLGGIITTKFGRKNTLLYNNIFFFLGGMLTCFAASPAMFCIGRMVSGAGCGLVFVTVPIYIAEVSPSRSDGLLTTFHHASVALGVLVSSLLSIYGSTPPVWRFTFGFVTIPAFIQSPLLYLLCVETPVHLILMNKFTLAEDALRTLRDGEFVGIEFTEMKRLQRMPVNVEEKEQTPTESQPESAPVEVENPHPQPRPRSQPLIITCNTPTETIAEIVTGAVEPVVSQEVAPAEAVTAVVSAAATTTTASDTSLIDSITPSTAPEVANTNESSKQSLSVGEGSLKQQVSAKEESPKPQVSAGEGSYKIENTLSSTTSGSSGSSGASAAVATVNSLPTAAQTSEKTEVEEASDSSASDPSNLSTLVPSIQNASSSSTSLAIEQAPPTTSTPANSPVDIEAGPQVSIQYYPIMGLRSIFTNGKELRNRVIAVIYINVIQQLFGISAVVFFYPTRIMSFYDEGAGADYAVGITICYFYSIILAMLLLDHVPNYRNLMAGSGIGILLFSILFTIGFVTGAPLLSLISVYLYIISFTMGACMIPSIILGRGIATHAVASTSSISTALAWLIQILIAQCFPLLLSSIQGYVFLIFGFSTIGLIPFMHYVFIKGLD